MSEEDPLFAVAESLKEIASALSQSGTDWVTLTLTILGPLLTAAVAIVSILYQANLSRKALEESTSQVKETIASETARKFGEYYIEHRLKQLNEFYGKIHSLNSA